LDAVDAGTLKFVPAANFLSHLSEKEQTYLLLVMERDEVSPSLGQAQRLKQLSGEGKREIVKPCFFVLRRRTLTFGAALLMAVAIFGAVNAPAAVRASAATRQLPIYCVERDQKVCSILFDAVWGADNTQRIANKTREAIIVAKADNLAAACVHLYEANRQ